MTGRQKESSVLAVFAAALTLAAAICVNFYCEPRLGEEEVTEAVFSDDLFIVSDSAHSIAVESVTDNADKENTVVVRYIMVIHVRCRIINGRYNVAFGRCRCNTLNMAKARNPAKAVLVAGRNALLGNLLTQVLTSLVADGLLFLTFFLGKPVSARQTCSVRVGGAHSQ